MRRKNGVFRGCCPREIPENREDNTLNREMVTGIIRKIVLITPESGEKESSKTTPRLCKGSTKFIGQGVVAKD